ncbi:MAG: cation:dicarboxylase symporter family transporter, partial [Planctomycetaceae bacterium]|nr:cation:dicarboxylase symporter family transporter [Planctomycetaceae bacterium]
MTASSPTSHRLPLHYQILIAMVSGTVIGLMINPGEFPIGEPVTLVVQKEGDSIHVVERLASQADASATATDDSVLTKKTFADGSAFEKSFPRLSESLGDEQQLTLSVTNPSVRVQYEMNEVVIIWRRTHGDVPAVSEIRAKTVEKLPPFWRTLAGQHPPGLRSSVVIGVRFLGDLFLRMLKMVTVPLIVTSLVTGVAGLGQHGKFGRMFSRTLLYYLSTSMIAIFTGIVLVNVINPGVGAILPGGAETQTHADGSLLTILSEQVLRMIPVNPIEAIANGEFLSIISFSILFGLFITLVGGEHGHQLSGFFDAAFQVMMRMTTAVIALAPYGVGAFMIYATATQGFGIFGTLAKYMVTVFAAL